MGRKKCSHLSWVLNYEKWAFFDADSKKAHHNLKTIE